jgi:RecA/RadA recombinase
MKVIGLLVRALIENKDNPYLKLQFQKDDIVWASNNLIDEQFCATLRAILIYSKKMSACPDSFITLRQYIQINSESVKFFKQRREEIYEEITELEQDKSEVATDTNVLLELVFDEGLKAYDINSLIEEIDIRKGVKNWPEDSGETGQDAAVLYRQQSNAKRRDKKLRTVDGDLVKNIDYVDSLFESFLQKRDIGRIVTGFDHIDDATLIGQGYPNRWIGILGYTNHGKSMYLMSLLYNMALTGKRVLLVPREFSVDEAYMRFAFMHAKNFPDMPIISLNDWQMTGEKGISLDVWETKEFLIKDLKEGDTLKGSLDVKQFDTLNQIVDYARAMNASEPFDVIAVDYLTHLEVKVMKGMNEVEAHKQDFRKCQMLSQNGVMNDKKGITIITPLQANKDGYEKATKDKTGGDFGVYESLGAVEWYTQAAQDMDLIISVFYEGDDLRDNDPPQMRVACMKSRSERFFNTHLVQVDVKTRYVHDMGKGRSKSTLIKPEDRFTEDEVVQRLNMDDDRVDKAIG